MTAEDSVGGLTDPDVVVRRVAQRELAHPPRFILHRRHRQSVAAHAGMPVVDAVNDEEAARSVARRVDVDHVKVKDALLVELDEREPAPGSPFSSR